MIKIGMTNWTRVPTEPVGGVFLFIGPIWHTPKSFHIYPIYIFMDKNNQQKEVIASNSNCDTETWSFKEKFAKTHHYRN